MIVLKKSKERVKTVRINTTITGIYADIILELKKRGIASNNTDAIRQALMALKEKIVENDLAIARLKQLQELNEV
jgi:Arc/MetJ-type ribon-helix-helix transcriptional regulator